MRLGGTVIVQRVGKREGDDPRAVQGGWGVTVEKAEQEKKGRDRKDTEQEKHGAPG